MKRIVKIWVLVGVLMGVLMGCCIPGCRSTGQRPGIAPISAQQISDLLGFHNQRVREIQRLWARVSVRIKGVDAQGQWFEEQGEGHLQVTRPESVSLTIGKLGETYFAYGSSSDRYWMFDLSDSDHRVGLVGQVDRLTTQRAGEIGLSVHPGDLISVLGLELIEPDRVLDTHWDTESGTLVVSFSSRWGRTEYWFDTARGLPVLVRSLDAKGDPMATSGLSRYKPLLNARKLDSGVLVPGKVEIRDPREEGGFVRIEVSEPSQRQIRGMVYDPDRLSKAYRIHEMVDLDADEQAGPESSLP